MKHTYQNHSVKKNETQEHKKIPNQSTQKGKKHKKRNASNNFLENPPRNPPRNQKSNWREEVKKEWKTLLGLIIGILVFSAIIFWVDSLEPSGGMNQEDAQKILTQLNEQTGGNLTLLVFSDYQCPFCAQAHESVHNILLYTNVSVRFVNMPLERIHPDAKEASLVGICAFSQGRGWEYSDILFANQAFISPDFIRESARQAGVDMDKLDTCLSMEAGKKLYDDTQLAKALGVEGTPTFVIQRNGKNEKIEGNVERVIKRIIELLE